MTTVTFQITNLTCPACVKISEMTLKKIPGVSNVEIDLNTGTTSVESDEDIKDLIIESLKQVNKKVKF